jgi:SNF2 family DNA or RNA helicase
MVELGAERSNTFSKIFAKVHLRRTKEEVLRAELPTKDERIVFCELSELQKKIYQKLLSLPEFHLLRLAKTPCDCGINQAFFEYLKGIKTKEARLAFIRNNKKMIQPRNKCHYKVPRLDPMLDDSDIDPSEIIEVDPKAVLWRHSHDGDKACKQCPYCLLFPAMSRLMKVGTHAALIQPTKDPALMLETKERKEMERDLAIAKACIPKECLDQLPGKSYIRESSIMNDHFSLSGKMKVLDRLLRRIFRQGGRVLVFSASTKTLDLIQNYVKSSGKRYLRMDGTTDRKRRKELADEFKADHGITIFMLSTRAMGLGLNLTSANFVIIFDVEWNPSNDAQAQDRAYRLGQTSDVVVFRLVSMGTIEELKYLRQVYKTQLKNETIVDTDKEKREVAARLFRGVAGDKERHGELFGLANLLRFEDGTFMQYGEESRDSHRYGGDVFRTETLLTAAQTLDDQAVEEFDLGVSDLVALTEEGTISILPLRLHQFRVSLTTLTLCDRDADVDRCHQRNDWTRQPEYV